MFPRVHTQMHFFNLKAKEKQKQKKVFTFSPPATCNFCLIFLAQFIKSLSLFQDLFTVPFQLVSTNWKLCLATSLSKLQAYTHALKEKHTQVPTGLSTPILVTFFHSTISFTLVRIQFFLYFKYHIAT